PREAERWRAPDRVAGGRPGLLGAGPPDLAGPEDGGQLSDVGPVAPRRHRQHGLAVGHEHEGLHDLAHLAAHRPRGVRGGLRALREPLDVERQPAPPSCLLEPAQRPHGHSPAISAARSSSAAAVSFIARSIPNRSASVATRPPCGRTVAWPHTSTTGTPAPAAARITPAGVF